MKIERKEKVTHRRSQIPKAYRVTYDKAVNCQSLRAAINAQCLECVCWQIKEIRNCTDLACPLYAFRPYQSTQGGRNDGFSDVESKKSDSRGQKHGKR